MHCWAQRFILFSKTITCHNSSTKPITSCFAAYINYRISNTFGSSIKDFITFAKSKSKSIYQNISIITAIKKGFTPNGWHTHAVSIISDSSNNSTNQVALTFSSCKVAFNLPKTQGIHISNRTSPHGKNITQNPTNPSSSALIWLNKTWMIMALHLKNCRHSIAHINNTRIFTRSLNNPRGGCWESV